MASAADSEIWEQNGFMIVTKDAGFLQRSMLHGHPPKVIWIGSGNCATKAVAVMLGKHSRRLTEFGGDAESALLMLSS
jgi:predicted nuclease of predicted toxin-antitoxin system